jgi:hypothetical protein
MLESYEAQGNSGSGDWPLGRKPANAPSNCQILRSKLTRPREDFGPDLPQTARSNKAFAGFSAARNQSVGIAFGPMLVLVSHPPIMF